jgi:hypothetical protein
MADELLWPRQRVLVMVEFGRVCGRTCRTPKEKGVFIQILGIKVGRLALQSKYCPQIGVFVKLVGEE